MLGCDLPYDTFCASAIGETAHSPGTAADKADEKKRASQQLIQTRYRFEALAIETTGVYAEMGVAAPVPRNAVPWQLQFGAAVDGGN